MQKEFDVDNESKNFVNISDSIFERNNYFYGKLMTVDDFKQEQNYFNDKRYLINKLIHGTGVLCGLNVTDVKKDQEGNYLKFKLSSGCALDCNGKEVVVSNTSEIKLPMNKIIDLLKENKNGSKRFGIYLQRYDFPKSPVPTVFDNCTCDETCYNNRIAESYQVIPKKIEDPLKKIEFDNLVYDISDKVKLELWDPDAQQNEVEAKVSSINGQDLKTIKFIKKSQKRNIFETETEIQFTTDNTNHEANKLFVTMVNGYDTIIATYPNNVPTDSNTVTTDATVLAEKSFLFYKQEMVNTINRRKENKECSLCVSDSHSSGHVLIAVMRADENNNIELDNFLTTVTKKTVYNNPMLFALLERYKQSCVEPQPNLPTQPYTLVLSGETQIEIPRDFRKGSFKFSEEIKFDLPDEYKSYLSIPLVYLGRIKDEYPFTYTKSDRSTISYTEDMIYSFEKEFEYEYYDEKEKNTKNRARMTFPNFFPERKLLFKPISITKESFKIIVMRHRFDFDIEDEGEQLSIRWWATFPSILSTHPRKQ